MSFACEDTPGLHAFMRCIRGWENGPGSVPIYCDCPVVDGDAKAPHKPSDDTAIAAAEARKLDGQRTAIRRSLDEYLTRLTRAARKRLDMGLDGYEESLVMDLLDRAGALG